MLADGIGLASNEIEILSEPGEFYSRLIENIRSAEKELILTSLYIGNGEKESKLYDEIDKFLERGGNATIILDYNRGQRGKKSSIENLRQSMLKYPETLKVYVSLNFLLYYNFSMTCFF